MFGFREGEVAEKVRSVERKLPFEGGGGPPESSKKG